MNLTTSTILGALVLEIVVGDPSNYIHPVAWFGRLLDMADRDWRRPWAIGIVMVTFIPSIVAVFFTFFVGVAASWQTEFGLGMAILVVFSTTSYRSLLETVWRICRLADTDIAACRRELKALAGRTSDGLDSGQLRSAALESLGENLSDGLVAPLAAFTLIAVIARIGGIEPAWTLGLACGGAVWIKAINTMDSMWGYPDRTLGTGAARVDDAAMWIPARLSAVLIAFAFVAPRSLWYARRLIGGVPSPNAGWPMGTLAVVLDVRLEKPGFYDLNPMSNFPNGTHIQLALRRIGMAGLAAYALAGVVV